MIQTEKQEPDSTAATNSSPSAPNAGELSRRDFLRSAAAVGTGVVLAGKALGQDAPEPAPKQAPSSSGTPSSSDTLNIALIGCGAQGEVLVDAARGIQFEAGTPTIRFRAACDIYPYNLLLVSGRLKAYGQLVNKYEDYREMLDKEKDLHAVIVATPDWMHAEHAITCMEAGCHVYCEGVMSNSLEKARQMVWTARRTGRLLQIGHQRRSSPRYLHAINNIVHGNRILGRICQANAQWNRPKMEDVGWPMKYELSSEKLAQYGYDSMHQLRNWRWFRKYGGGPVVYLGSQQIDIFGWVFRGNPTSVMAGGGIGYYKNREWPENVMAIFEYATPEGKACALCQVLTTSSYGKYYEAFMGENATLQISELSYGTMVVVERHVDREEGDKWVEAGVLREAMAGERVTTPSGEFAVMEAIESPPGMPVLWDIPVTLLKPYHQYHLENFFNALLHGTPLNCPPETGFETAVAVLAVNKALEAGKTIHFKPEDFKV